MKTPDMTVEPMRPRSAGRSFTLDHGLRGNNNPGDCKADDEVAEKGRPNCATHGEEGQSHGDAGQPEINQHFVADPLAVIVSTFVPVSMPTPMSALAMPKILVEPCRSSRT